MNGTVPTLREVWRRLDRLERVSRSRLDDLNGDKAYADANFLAGAVSGIRQAKSIVEMVAVDLGAKAGLPNTVRTVKAVTNANGA